MPARKDLQTILIIGSGPIVIGQACEFDYSGVQAVKALKEEGYRVVLVNPNPATVMTTPGLADAVYTEPLETSYMEEIIIKERPDAILPTMGGQTALNLALELDKAGIIEKYGIELIGAGIRSIRLAEDRGQFKRVVRKIGLDLPRSTVVHSVPEAERFAEKTGFPLIIRPSFTLGGRGGSIAQNEEEFAGKVARALEESPAHEALIEESLIGWKEIEMEVMRDKADNAVIICSIENIDPMGIHTGDSVTVAPVQTLSDREYQTIRKASIDILRAVGVDCGGSNVQFGVDPRSGRIVVIEMNPRVSRSSALASKATGFPIARCAAKLAVGLTLDEILNEVTGKTVSCFEPVLDYVAVKVPRFETEKFPTGYKELGTQMKSVGESLALGRTFIEALNKAYRSIERKYEGLTELPVDDRQLSEILSTLHPQRLFAAFTKIKREGAGALEEINRLTGYDPWFLHEIAEYAALEADIAAQPLTPALLLWAKQAGMSDAAVARLTGMTAAAVEEWRRKENIHAVYHSVDTCAGEFAAETPYFYSGYGENDEGQPLGTTAEKAVIIPASGPNRIGQGLEFDTGCTLAALAYRKRGVKTILVNSNPETVSTDFNISDRLYIEPLTPEHVKEIMRKEKVNRVLVQLGGQTPLNMAAELEAAGAEIVGTSVKNIYAAEDRGLFSQLVRETGALQPRNRTAATPEEVIAAAEEIGYPVLLRPSFVIGGRSMFIAFTREELDEALNSVSGYGPDKPLLVDQFLEDAFEYDVDALCDGKNVYIAGIMQHIEAAGVHSGDSACVFPPYKSEPVILEAIRDVTVRIALKTGTVGFLNIQFASQGEKLYVLEVNPRASRTVPFISKATGVNLVDAAVGIWEGDDLETQGLTTNGFGMGRCVTGWAVKEAVFSFDRFTDIDPLLGPEMKSTGEVIGTGATFGEAYAKAQAAAGNRLPKRGRVFVSVHKKDRETILPIVKSLKSLGFKIAATRGTAAFLFEKGIFCETILKVHEGHPHITDHMAMGRFELLINTPLGGFSQKGDRMIRSEAVRQKIPYTTTTSAAAAAVEGIRYLKTGKASVRPLPAGSFDCFS